MAVKVSVGEAASVAVEVNVRVGVPLGVFVIVRVDEGVRVNRGVAVAIKARALINFFAGFLWTVGLTGVGIFVGGKICSGAMTSGPKASSHIDGTVSFLPSSSSLNISAQIAVTSFKFSVVVSLFSSSITPGSSSTDFNSDTAVDADG